MKRLLLFLAAIILFAVPFGFALFSHTLEHTVDSDSFFVWDWQLKVGYILTPGPTLLTNIILGASLVVGIIGLYRYTKKQEQAYPPKPLTVLPSRLTKSVGLIVLVVAALGFVGYISLAFPRIITSFAGKTARLPLLHNLLAGSFILLGSGGLLLMYQSYKRKSKLKLIVGFFVVLFMFVLLEMLFQLTLSWMR